MGKLQDKLYQLGICDDRKATFCATATNLPRGEHGMVLLAVKENKLSLYDVDMQSNPKDLLYTVPLNEIENLKYSTFVLTAQLKFTWKGEMFRFTNFAGVKPALEVIKTEAQK